MHLYGKLVSKELELALLDTLVLRHKVVLLDDTILAIIKSWSFTLFLLRGSI